MKWKKLKFDKH